MSYIVTEVRTLAELKKELEDTDNINNRLECRIMNDLDFNEEGFWYHPDPPYFFDINMARNNLQVPESYDPNHRYYLIDGGKYEEDPITHAQVLVGNNALTNIYTYPNSVVFKQHGNDQYHLAGGITIKNLDFEAVLNQSCMFVFKEGPAYGPLVFENCNFNLKIIGYPKNNIEGSGANPPIFFFSCSGTIGSGRSGHLRFVNCTFNVEITGSPERKFGGLFDADGTLSYSDISASVIADACEFRIKNMTNDCSFSLFGNGETLPTQRNTGSKANFYINNCAFFLNNYKPVNDNNIYIPFHNNTSSYRNTIMNSFFAAFAETADAAIDPDYRSIIKFKDDYATAVFYDSDRLVQQWIASSTERGEAHYALTTAECKSESKLREIGFLFATES